jgi:hypothetical protein
MARLLVLLSILLSPFSAWAADAICMDPPASDQTMWQGKDGTMSYCTSNIPSAYEVTFDGMVDPAGSVGITPALTLIEFSVAGRVGESTFQITPSDTTVPAVSGTAFFPNPVPPFILP